ncbi:hypothetical protein CEXT_360331 [Caerostris extrusa]|uniref:Uncharacterized protein n=1 Tax=Caerostris extrusa TaxID=172846 RepID=A0AAV4WIH9_CAEEX|nr:hypothetical protein CEXT_360331 [Caerostris extrusa]
MQEIWERGLDWDSVTGRFSVKVEKKCCAEIEGPVWLRGSRNQWPRQKFERVTDEKKLEKLNTSVHAILPQTEMILDENKFSNLRKLLRVTAWVKRFVAKLRKRLARVER